MPVADKNGTAKIMKRKLIRPPVFGVERFDYSSRPPNGLEGSNFPVELHCSHSGGRPKWCTTTVG